MTRHKISNEADLVRLIKNACEKKRCTKVRVFEDGKSYEDYSISYTLSGKAIYNFTVSVKDGFIVIQKRAKNSTKHVMFAVGSIVIMDYVDKHVPYCAVDVIDHVRYTDGTHRYIR